MGKDELLMYNYLLKSFCLQFLQMALWSCLSELRLASGMPEHGLSLPWVHLAYQHFRMRLQNFSRILTIHPQVLRSLSKAAEKHSLAGCELVRAPLGKANCACPQSLLRTPSWERVTDSLRWARSGLQVWLRR